MTVTVGLRPSEPGHRRTTKAWAAGLLLALFASAAHAENGWPPPDGAVPTAEVAIAIALAIFNGKKSPGSLQLSDVLDGDLLVAEAKHDAVDGDVWIVQDGPDICHTKPGDAPCAGGYLFAEIRKRDGAVLFFTLEE